MAGSGAEAEAEAEAAPAPTLASVVSHEGLKWVFVGGKGGVGKTTTACCLALRLAARRDRVLLISTDPAHNLSDAFRQKFTRRPTRVEGVENLYAMEVDPTPETPDVDADADGAAGAAGGPLALVQDLASSIPGIDEAMSFAEILQEVGRGEADAGFDVVVFDTAPTGHTLRLLQFPTLIGKLLTQALALSSGFGGILRQVSALLGGPAGSEADDIVAKLRGLQDVVASVNAQFTDPELTTFVAVAIPEFLSLYETERLVQELAKHEIDVQNIVVNQVLYADDADVAASRLLQARARMQRKYLDQFADLYDDFHLVHTPLLPEEVRGLDALRSFSRHLLEPYSPPPALPGGDPRVAALEREVAALRAENEALRRGG